MCRFKTKKAVALGRVKDFNTSYVSVQGKGLYRAFGTGTISIHLMCRFKKDIRALEKEIDYFNTSYVSVQVLNMYP